MLKWFSRAKITPLQLLIMFALFFYFVYLNTEIFEELLDLVKILIYASGLILTALAGYSAIDAKKLGRLIKKTMRQKDKSYETRWNECIEIIDNALFDLDLQKKQKQIQNNKKKRSDKKIG